MSRMANQGTAGAGDSPAELLNEVKSLRSQVAAAAPGYWLPLLIFGLVICGSLPFYRRIGTTVPSVVRRLQAVCSGPHPCHLVMRTFTDLFYYWQFAIPVAIIATVLWYRWRGNRTGLRTPARGFLIAGLIICELALIFTVAEYQPTALFGLVPALHQVSAYILIAIVLWVLAWSERSRALAIIVAAFLVVAIPVGQITRGGLAGGTAQTSLSITQMRLLGLLPAAVLIVAGAAAWLIQRFRARSAEAA
jgi:hypothetical protein